jgi:hypothetical protein
MIIAAKIVLGIVVLVSAVVVITATVAIAAILKALYEANRK